MKKISVIGAGLVGSLWALYLGKKGHHVNVYERRPDMRKTNLAGGRSINLALSQRGLKALKEVGLEEDVKKMTIPMHGRMIHHLDGSTELQPYGKEGQFINSISRSGLNMLMMDKAENLKNVSFEFGNGCLGYDSEKKEAILESGFTQSELIFGTDGAFSAVRNSMMKSDRFNYRQDYLEHGYKELSIPTGKNGGFQMEKNALHIWPRKSFMLIALPNMDGSFTVTLFLAFEGEYAFEHLQNEKQVLEFFKEHFLDAVTLMPNLADDFFANPTSSLVTVRCYPWSLDNKVLLLGDAAHAIVPFYGQGMNAGFEDCFILNEMMKEAGGNWSEIIPEFQQRRKPDADAIAELALRNFVEMRDSVVDSRFVLRKKIEKLMHERYPDKFTPLYSMVTFSELPYSKALEKGKVHDAFFESKKLQELESVLHDKEGVKLIEKWIGEL